VSQIAPIECLRERLDQIAPAGAAAHAQSNEVVGADQGRSHRHSESAATLTAASSLDAHANV
jgi:hypothetical protein